MLVKAKLRHLHISPRKVRLVVDVIRGLDVVEAENQLKFLNKASASPILKLLNSATSNAVNNFDMERDNLSVKTILVNEGPTLKRWRPRAYGRAFTVFKRASHIEIGLEEKVKGKKKRVSKKDVKNNVDLKIDKGSIESDKDASKKPWERDKGKKGSFFVKKVSGVKDKLFRRKSI